MPEATEKKKFDPTLIVIVALAAIVAVRSPEFFKGVIYFVVTLSVLVFVHEWGHYQFARWAGMKVNRFALGFPPWIYTKRRNGIDYSIGALPIGGMVDIAGLGSEEEMVATTRGGIPEVGEKVSSAPVYVRRPDRPRGEKQFQDASLGWRFLALFAGPLMNFIYAIIVFIALFSIHGIPKDHIRSNVVEMVQPGMPAFVSDIHYGDEIIGINGQRSSKVDTLIDKISSANGKPVILLINRGGQELSKTLTPIVEEVENYNAKGELDGYKKAARIGISFSIRPSRYEKLTPVEAVKYGILVWIDNAKSILSMLGRTATGRLTSGEVREIGGPVKIGQTVNLLAKKGWFEIIVGSATLSLNLGLLNLLPLPALDGGRIMFLGYELVARKPIDPNKESFVHVVGMVMLLTFMVLITARDIWPFLERGIRGLTG